MVKINKSAFLSRVIQCPLQIWTLQISNQYISKTVIAKSFKLAQLIEDDE